MLSYREILQPLDRLVLLILEETQLLFNTFDVRCGRVAVFRPRGDRTSAEDTACARGNSRTSFCHVRVTLSYFHAVGAQEVAVAFLFDDRAALMFCHRHSILGLAIIRPHAMAVVSPAQCDNQ